jgi:hypothetical protein
LELRESLFAHPLFLRFLKKVFKDLRKPLFAIQNNNDAALFVDTFVNTFRENIALLPKTVKLLFENVPNPSQFLHQHFITPVFCSPIAYNVHPPGFTIDPDITNMILRFIFIRIEDIYESIMHSDLTISISYENDEFIYNENLKGVAMLCEGDLINLIIMNSISHVVEAQKPTLENFPKNIFNVYQINYDEAEQLRRTTVRPPKPLMESQQIELLLRNILVELDLFDIDKIESEDNDFITILKELSEFEIKEQKIMIQSLIETLETKCPQKSNEEFISIIKTSLANRKPTIGNKLKRKAQIKQSLFIRFKQSNKHKKIFKGWKKDYYMKLFKKQTKSCNCLVRSMIKFTLMLHSSVHFL